MHSIDTKQAVFGSPLSIKPPVVQVADAISSGFCTTKHRKIARPHRYELRPDCPGAPPSSFSVGPASLSSGLGSTPPRQGHRASGMTGSSALANQGCVMGKPTVADPDSTVIASLGPAGVAATAIARAISRDTAVTIINLLIESPIQPSTAEGRH